MASRLTPGQRPASQLPRRESGSPQHGTWTGVEWLQETPREGPMIAAEDFVETVQRLPRRHYSPRLRDDMRLPCRTLGERVFWPFEECPGNQSRGSRSWYGCDLHARPRNPYQDTVNLLTSLPMPWFVTRTRSTESSGQGVDTGVTWIGDIMTG